MRGTQSQITAIFGGMLAIVIGLVLLSIVNSQAATTGASANIGSFSGVQSLNDLVPLVFVAALVFVGIGLMAVGGAGVAGIGPLRRGG